MGVLAEDVEDHGGAVDRRAPEQLLQVVLLRRRQLVVEHDGVGVDGEAQLLELLDLALADVPGVIGRVAPLHDPLDDVGAGGVDEQGELVEAGLDVLVVVSGRATPTSTIFSRIVRSIRVPPRLRCTGCCVMSTSISMVPT